MTITEAPGVTGVNASGSAWSQASGWQTRLDDFNDGELWAPHRD